MSKKHPSDYGARAIIFLILTTPFVLAGQAAASIGAAIFGIFKKKNK